MKSARSIIPHGLTAVVALLVAGCVTTAHFQCGYEQGQWVCTSTTGGTAPH